MELSIWISWNTGNQFTETQTLTARPSHYTCRLLKGVGQRIIGSARQLANITV